MTEIAVRTLVRRLSISRLAQAGALLIAGVLAMPAPASAVVNANVRSACLSDYFAYCAGYEVGSRQLRSCMSRAGSKLSPGCVNALVAAGEVSKAEVDRRSRRATRTASRPKAKSRSVRRQYATLR